MRRIILRPSATSLILSKTISFHVSNAAAAPAICQRAAAIVSASRAATRYPFHARKHCSTAPNCSLRSASVAIRRRSRSRARVSAVRAAHAPKVLARSVCTILAAYRLRNAFASAVPSSQAWNTIVRVRFLSRLTKGRITCCRRTASPNKEAHASNVSTSSWLRIRLAARWRSARLRSASADASSDHASKTCRITEVGEAWRAVEWRACGVEGGVEGERGGGRGFGGVRALTACVRSPRIRRSTFCLSLSRRRATSRCSDTASAQPPIAREA